MTSILSLQPSHLQPNSLQPPPTAPPAGRARFTLIDMWGICYFYESAIPCGASQNSTGYAYWTGRKRYVANASWQNFDTRKRREDPNEVIMSDVTCGSGNGVYVANTIDHFYGGGYNLPLYSFTPHNGLPFPQPGQSGSGNLVLASGTVVPYQLNTCRSSINVHMTAKAKMTNVTPAPQDTENGPYFILDQ